MVELTDDSFEKEVLQEPLPTLVDFWAPWCGPCRALSPILEDLETSYAGKVKFTKINTDEQFRVVTDHKIMSIPTVLIFKDGKVVAQSIGLKTKEDLKKILDNL